MTTLQEYLEAKTPNSCVPGYAPLFENAISTPEYRDIADLVTKLDQATHHLTEIAVPGFKREEIYEDTFRYFPRNKPTTNEIIHQATEFFSTEGFNPSPSPCGIQYRKPVDECTHEDILLTITPMSEYFLITETKIRYNIQHPTINLPFPPSQN